MTNDTENKLFDFLAKNFGVQALQTDMQEIENILLEGKSVGAELIKAERSDQLLKHNWTAEHDDEHDCSELASAAVACLILDEHITTAGYLNATSMWPWRSDPWFRNIERKDRIGQLTVAGALIAAEIDRIWRKSSSKAKR